MSRPASRASPVLASAQQLERLRDQIDAVNEEILRAIERRGALVLRVSEQKRQLGAPSVDATREAEMLARIAALVRGPYSRADVQSIFRAIVVASRGLQDERGSAGSAQSGVAGPGASGMVDEPSERRGS